MDTSNNINSKRTFLNSQLNNSSSYLIQFLFNIKFMKYGAKKNKRKNRKLRKKKTNKFNKRMSGQ